MLFLELRPLLLREVSLRSRFDYSQCPQDFLHLDLIFKLRQAAVEEPILGCLRTAPSPTFLRQSLFYIQLQRAEKVHVDLLKFIYVGQFLCLLRYLRLQFLLE